MNKRKLISQIAANCNMKQKEVSNCLDAIAKTIQDALVAGETVKVMKLGSFKAVETKARTVKSPQDGSLIQIAAGVRARFKAGSDLLSALKKSQ